jgi:hypothetical protein
VRSLPNLSRTILAAAAPLTSVELRCCNYSLVIRRADHNTWYPKPPGGGPHYKIWDRPKREAPGADQRFQPGYQITVDALTSRS